MNTKMKVTMLGVIGAGALALLSGCPDGESTDSGTSVAANPVTVDQSTRPEVLAAPEPVIIEPTVVEVPATPIPTPTPVAGG